MKDDSGLVTLVVVVGLALLGFVLWKKGVFGKFAAFLAPATGKPPNQAQGVAGGIGPNEYGPAAPQGGSAYGRVCNEFHARTGQVLVQTQDPRAQAAGIVTQVGGPLFCAGTEYAAEKAWQGTKYVGTKTADAAKSLWNKIF